MDGTCVSAWAKGKRQETFRNRKTAISQNILAVVDFDKRFIFVHSGWEGSAHDSKVFLNAVSHPELGFPHLPKGKYYLVDAGYTNQRGYLAPYRGENYHRDQFQGHTRYRGPKELFNHRHSSLRNVVKCTFGVLKQRYGILRGPMPRYKTMRQATIVLACCVVHNFIRDHDLEDEFFARVDEFNLVTPRDGEEGSTSAAIDPAWFMQPVSTEPDNESWSNFRDNIANQLWSSLNT